MEQKLKKAKTLIRQALKKHGNKIYVAYSGGKDSKALLKLVREIQPNVIVIHNQHDGEVCDIKEALIIKGPKKQFVKKALSYLNIEAQFDGTRADEDKLVMINGKDIHRSKMTTNYTEKGVWGLEVYFPLKDFTEKEIFTYLKQKCK